MRRYFYPDSLQRDHPLTLQGELFHHIFDVCRLQVGQHFELLNSSGMAYLVRVTEVGKKSACVLVCEERQIPTLKEPHLHLYLSFPKVSTFESIVEKSVEMGVKSITPLLSDFSSVRTKAQFPSVKIPRWQKIILQATQQSGRGDLMQLHDVQLLDECFNNQEHKNPETLMVVAYEGPAPMTFKQYLTHRKSSFLKNLHVYVGSEGGFSDQEIQRFMALDLPPVTLGDQVLRVETACMTLVSGLKYEFDL